ncbi:hypothetical protein E2C01_039587 [Portunus trituberculatus]|uniref:Uncharacterized protein n=1 Tax=Portunus trituberculatus TaxID=210409 RepID=A0A5B7FF41_PORTR|nr:hypothetical protein [Portunus trituberculatus]
MVQDGGYRRSHNQVARCPVRPRKSRVIEEMARGPPYIRNSGSPHTPLTDMSLLSVSYNASTVPSFSHPSHVSRYRRERPQDMKINSHFSFML